MDNTPNPFEFQSIVLHDAVAEYPVSSTYLRDTEENRAAQIEGFHPMDGVVLSASEMYALYAAFLEKVRADQLHAGEGDFRSILSE
jgi:hypothetical protein